MITVSLCKGDSLLNGVQSPNLYTFSEAQESIANLAGRNDNPFWRTGPPGYIGCRIPLLGSLNVYKFILRIQMNIKT
jgi:hypothetical protein